MGTRQRSQLPIRDSRKHLQNTVSESTINDKVPKDLKLLSSGKNRLKNPNNIAPHLRDPLTPLHRLRRFQEIRDRNLKKSSFGKARFNKNKMSVDVEKDDTSKGRRSVKEIKGTKDNKISNGTQENGDKVDEISPKREDKTLPVEDNKEVNGSQEKVLTDEPQQIESEKSQTTEAKKQVDSEKPKQIENDEKSPQIENEKNRTDNVIECEIEEKQIIVKENEIITKENNDSNVDKIKETNKKVEIEEDDDDEIEILELDTEEEENRETDYESFSNDEPQEKVKILRRSFRQELLRAKASTDQQIEVSTNASSSISTNASSSISTNASSSTSTTSTRASTSTKASSSKEVENFVEKPKEKRLPLSPETIRRIKAKKVEGRRSLWQSTGTHRKRKYDDYNEDSFYRYGKKPASNQTIQSTPSVLSPGWKFISSPFTRFLTPRNSPPPGLTPYKSLTTPYPQNDIEDSLAVNVDDKSLYNKLNDSEFDISLNSTESTATTSSWRCNIM